MSLWNLCGVRAEWGRRARAINKLLLWRLLYWERSSRESSVVVTTPGMFRGSNTMGRDGDPINASIMTRTLHTGAKIISTTKIWLFQACCEWCGLTDGIPFPVFYRRTQIPVLVVNILINSRQGEKPGKSPDLPFQWVSISFQTFPMQPGST